VRLRQLERRLPSPGRRKPVSAAGSVVAVVAASGCLARRARRLPARRRRPRRWLSPWSVGAWRESRASVSRGSVPRLDPADRRTRSRRASVIASHICQCHASVRPPYRHGRAKSTAHLRMSRGGLRPQRRCDRGPKSAVRNTPWRNSRSSGPGTPTQWRRATRRRREWRSRWPPRRPPVSAVFSLEWRQPPEVTCRAAWPWPPGIPPRTGRPAASAWPAAGAERSCLACPEGQQRSRWQRKPAEPAWH